MIWIFLIIALGIAGLGGYLIGDFCVWLFKGRVVSAVIKGFEERKDKGLKLPIVVFEDKRGAEHRVSVKRIDQFLFLFNRPQDESPTTIIYKVDAPDEARIYGYINVIAGLFLMIPFFVVWAIRAEENPALTQLSYAVTFGVIILGGWAVLKLIQKYY